MDAKKVQALLAAVDLGSLTSAASELGYTQSGLTHMMTSLETELGLTLLLRGQRSSCASAIAPPCGWGPIPVSPATGCPRLWLNTARSARIPRSP